MALLAKIALKGLCQKALFLSHLRFRGGSSKLPIVSITLPNNKACRKLAMLNNSVFSNMDRRVEEKALSLIVTQDFLCRPHLQYYACILCVLPNAGLCSWQWPDYRQLSFQVSGFFLIIRPMFLFFSIRHGDRKLGQQTLKSQES